MPLDRAALAQLRKRLQRGLVGVAVELTNQARVRATKHVFTGELRNATTHTSLSNGTVLWGMTGTAKHVALERGFNPHWVPGRIIGTWGARKNVGVTRATVTRGKRKGKPGRILSQTLGIFVGGPGSTLEQGPGQPGAKFYAGGRRLVFRRYNTKGGKSPYLAPNKVGFSILQWTIKTRLRAVSVKAFTQAYKAGN